MLGRFLITASIAALISAAPAVAAKSQQPVYMPPSGAQQGTMQQQMPAGQAGQSTGQAEQTRKIIQPNPNSQPTGTQPKQNQATGGTGEKTKKIQQGQESQPSGQMTTGATGKMATEIPAEKRTVVREKIVATNVERIERSKININISVGAVIPNTIRLHAVPEEVVRILPAYRGFLFFVLDDGMIVLVEPGTLRVAYVLAA